jgi:hypothetical protein
MSALISIVPECVVNPTLSVPESTEAIFAGTGWRSACASRFAQRNTKDIQKKFPIIARK